MLLGWKNISDSDVLGPALEADCRLFASHPTVPWCPGSDAAAQAQCSDLTVAPWSFLATRPSTLDPLTTRSPGAAAPPDASTKQK